MTTQTLGASSKTGYTITLTSLASATYVASSAVDLSAVDPLDIVVEVSITPGTVSGNKQAVVFIQGSLDNSVFSTGPTSGTTNTDQPNLYQIGVLALNTNSTLQTGQYSVMAALGWIPPYHKLVVLNDSGAAFSASNCSASYATYTGNSA